MKRKFLIKQLAQARNMTSEELAQKSGIKISTVRNVWQNRVSDPSLSTMDSLARALEVSIEDLYEEAEEVPSKTRTPALATA